MSDSDPGIQLLTHVYCPWFMGRFGVGHSTILLILSKSLALNPVWYFVWCNGDKKEDPSQNCWRFFSLCLARPILLFHIRKITSICEKRLFQLALLSSCGMCCRARGIVYSTVTCNFESCGGVSELWYWPKGTLQQGCVLNICCETFQLIHPSHYSSIRFISYF